MSCTIIPKGVRDVNSENSKKEYMARINQVIDYIEKNLDKNLSLEELSSVALFSKYHFHRIFKSLIGESVKEYTKRLRLEKSLILLKNFQDYSITDVGLEVGFSSVANFSAAFKNYYGITPSIFKKDKDISLVKKPLPNGKIRVDRHVKDNEKYGKISIKKLPDYHVIYVRHIGSYFQATAAWRILTDYAEKNDLIDKKTLMIGISYDDPQITDEKKLRFDACLTVNNAFCDEQEIGTKNILGGLYGIYNFYGTPEELIYAYDYIYAVWFPNSGYFPDDKSCFEIYQQQISKNQKKVPISICVPIRK